MTWGTGILAFVVVVVVFFIGRATLFSHAVAIGKKAAVESLSRIANTGRSAQVHDMARGFVLAGCPQSDKEIVGKAIDAFREKMPLATLRVAFEEKLRGDG